jgi:tetratricopeptide (TPR) repeat protein
MFWVGPYESPGGFRAFIEYGPLVLAAGAGFVLWIRDAVRRRPAAGVFVAAAAAATVGLYLLMSRLTIFLAPWVAVLAFYAVVGLGRTRWRVAMAVALAALVFLHSYVAISRHPPGWLQGPLAAVTGYKPDIPWYYGSERVELLLWLADGEDAADGGGEVRPVLADFAFSPPLLYLTGRPIVLNPMFEVPEVRRKALTYAEAATSDEETFYRQCREWGVKHVLHFAPQVLSTGTGSYYNAAARMPEPGSAAHEMQFHPEDLRRFRLVFETYSVRVFEVGKPYDGYAATAYHPLYDAGLFPDIPTDGELDAFYRDRRRADEYYTLAVEAQDAGNFVAAAAALGNVLRLHPDYEDANLRLGFCNIQLNQIEDARRALERDAVSRPHDPRARRYLDMLEGSGGGAN